MVATRQTLLTLVAFTGRAFPPSMEYARSSTAEQAMVWSQAGVAILVLLGALVVHLRVQPFRFEFQNRLETGLFVSDILVVGLCLTYTVLPLQNLAIEVAAAAVLVGALLAGLVYTLRHPQSSAPQQQRGARSQRRTRRVRGSERKPGRPPRGPCTRRGCGSCRPA